MFTKSHFLLTGYSFYTSFIFSRDEESQSTDGPPRETYTDSTNPHKMSSIMRTKEEKILLSILD
ncbi:MAG: hypothetical protein D3909_04165, partial [Candidatus Electrothrix sp. ATG1]|nr:hypothetical protein [Candidatus Electrothrix sp. ATG1]